MRSIINFFHTVTAEYKEKKKIIRRKRTQQTVKSSCHRYFSVTISHYNTKRYVILLTSENIDSSFSQTDWLFLAQHHNLFQSFWVEVHQSRSSSHNSKRNMLVRKTVDTQPQYRPTSYAWLAVICLISQSSDKEMLCAVLLYSDHYKSIQPNSPFFTYFTFSVNVFSCALCVCIEPASEGDRHTHPLRLPQHTVYGWCQQPQCGHGPVHQHHKPTLNKQVIDILYMTAVDIIPDDNTKHNTSTICMTHSINTQKIQYTLSKCLRFWII